VGDGQVRRVELPEQRSHPFSLAKEQHALSLRPKKHEWLQAWIFALKHPFFAVTDKRGRFEIEGLPPGAYTFRAWHETFGEGAVQVTVPDSGAVRADFKFEP
jgi:hypothetical protein